MGGIGELSMGFDQSGLRGTSLERGAIPITGYQFRGPRYFQAPGARRVFYVILFGTTPSLVILAGPDGRGAWLSS